MKKILSFFLITFSMSAIADVISSELYTSDFEDANETLISFINDRGAVISYTSHAHKMLERTAPSISPDYDVYSDALIHLFCTAPQAHKMVAKNPHVLPYCPYSMAIYKLKKETNKVYLSYRSNEAPIYSEPMMMLAEIMEEMKGEYSQ